MQTGNTVHIVLERGSCDGERRPTIVRGPGAFDRLLAVN